MDIGKSIHHYAGESIIKNINRFRHGSISEVRLRSNNDHIAIVMDELVNVVYRKMMIYWAWT
jgi:hypothetical protein